MPLPPPEERLTLAEAAQLFDPPKTKKALEQLTQRGGLDIAREKTQEGTTSRVVTTRAWLEEYVARSGGRARLREEREEWTVGPVLAQRGEQPVSCRSGRWIAQAGISTSLRPATVPRGSSDSTGSPSSLNRALRLSRTCSSGQSSATRCMLSPGLPAYPPLKPEGHDRPVTPEVAGSSPSLPSGRVPYSVSKIHGPGGHALTCGQPLIPENRCEVRRVEHVPCRRLRLCPFARSRRRRLARRVWPHRRGRFVEALRQGPSVADSA
jgi:hypothetical protein